MKKSFAYVFCLVLVISFICFVPNTYAQSPNYPGMHSYQTLLTIVSDQQSFWVFIDDVQQNETSTRSIKIEQVPAGEHYLRVEMDNNEHFTFGQYVLIDQSGNSYRIDNQRHLYGFAIYHGVPRPERVVSYQKAVTAQHPYGDYEHHHGGHPQYPDMHHPMPVPTPVPGPIAMNEIDFQRALSVIKSEDFENTKLSTAKQVASNNLLTVNQISRICRLFEFDNSRLDFAKSAYSHCVDRNQYYLLHSVFEFDSNKKELDKFVQQQK